jgi:hypothetical protein
MNVGLSDIGGQVDMKLIYGITAVKKRAKLEKESKVRIKETIISSFVCVYFWSNKS